MLFSFCALHSPKTDELYGDFEDLESGEKHEAQEDTINVSEDEDKEMSDTDERKI